MATTEVNSIWFGTGNWGMERRATPRQPKVQHLSTLEQLALAANSCRNKQEQIFLYITDFNPELEELSIQLNELHTQNI